MSIIIFLFYIIITIYIIGFVFKFIKVFNENNSNILNNIQNISNDIEIKVRPEYMSNRVQDEVNLDDYMKMNTNPIKEKSGKRSRI